MYTVKNLVVENPDIVYNDGVTRVFLYTGGTKGGSDELRSLLNFMEQSTKDNATDSDLCKIQEILDDIRNNEEVGERYMTWEEMMEYEKRDSYEAGMYAGIEAGFIKAYRKMNKSDDEIVCILMDEFSLTKEEATNKVANN